MRLYNVLKCAVMRVKTIKICTKYPVSARLTDIIFFCQAIKYIRFYNLNQIYYNIMQKNEVST